MTSIFRTAILLGLILTLCSCYSLSTMVNHYEVIGHLIVKPSTDHNYNYQVYALEHSANSISEYSMVTRENREHVIEALMPLRHRNCASPTIVSETRLKREEHDFGPDYAWLMNVRCK